MKTYLLQFITLLIAINLPVIPSQSPPNCNIDGGGCSDFCFFTGGNLGVTPENSRCSCPCGQPLGSDNRTCDESFCGFDVLIVIDDDEQIDSELCDIANYSGPYPNWEKWRDEVGAFISNLAAFEAMSNNRVGVRLHPTINNLYVPIEDFTTNNIGSILSVLPQSPECMPVQSSSGFAALDFFPSATVFRPKESTTRIGIVFEYRYNQVLPDNSLAFFRDNLLQSDFDQIIVVTRTQSTDDERNTERARITACGDASAPCPNVFWLDRPNDFGVPFTLATLTDKFDPEACILNNVETNPLTQLSCENGRMSYALGLCPLSGMTLDLLQADDSTCDLNSFATLGTRETAIMNFALGECGMVEEYFVEGGVIMHRYTQTISTRNINFNQLLPTVSYTVSCTLNTLTGIYTAGLRPAAVDRNGTATNTGNFDLTYAIYDDADFTTLAPNMMFVIGCNVYVEIDAEIFVGLELVLWKCWATPSSNADDALNYTLADDGCPSDPTFTDYNNSMADVYRFSFEMFEFSSGYKQPTSEKLLIYVHCKFWICLESDTSPSCNPSCDPVRKRRSISDDGDERKSVISTMGPFKVEKNDAKKVVGDTPDAISQQDGSNTEVKPVQPPPTKNQMKTTKQQKTPAYKEQDEEAIAADAKEIKQPSLEDQRHGLSSDLFSSFRRIEIVIPTSSDDWNSLLSTPSFIFLLLLTCLLLIVAFGWGKKRNYPQQITENPQYKIVSPNMQLPIKQALPSSDGGNQGENIPPPEYKP